MIDLILIIMLIVSLFKPDVLLSKKMKERATDEQKKILTKNLRKIYAILVVTFESAALRRYTETEFVGTIVLIVFLILFFVIALPAIKENLKITKELN